MACQGPRPEIYYWFMVMSWCLRKFDHPCNLPDRGLPRDRVRLTDRIGKELCDKRTLPLFPVARKVRML
jgi:hypothetical protein